jgi:hypothetical protein
MPCRRTPFLALRRALAGLPVVARKRRPAIFDRSERTTSLRILLWAAIVVIAVVPVTLFAVRRQLRFASMSDR